jgi:hypothetical protein
MAYISSIEVASTFEKFHKNGIGQEGGRRADAIQYLVEKAGFRIELGSRRRDASS